MRFLTSTSLLLLAIAIDGAPVQSAGYLRQSDTTPKSKDEDFHPEDKPYWSRLMQDTNMSVPPMPPPTTPTAPPPNVPPPVPTPTQTSGGPPIPTRCGGTCIPPGQECNVPNAEGALGSCCCNQMGCTYASGLIPMAFCN